MVSAETLIEQIYQRDAKLKREDVKKLSDWAEMQPHLPKMSGEFYVLLNYSLMATCKNSRTSGLALPAQLLLQQREGQGDHRQLLHGPNAFSGGLPGAESGKAARFSESRVSTSSFAIGVALIAPEVCMSSCQNRRRKETRSSTRKSRIQIRASWIKWIR